MKIRSSLFLVALVAAAPASLSAQSVQDFQLPPNPTPTASPRAQGPVDTESGNLPVTPRVIATTTPTPRSTSTVQPLPTPTATPESPADPASESPLAPNRPTVAPRSQPTALPTGEGRLPLDPGETAPIVPAPQPTEQPAFQPTRTASSPPSSDLARDSVIEESPNWLWPAVGGSLLALLGLGYWLSRRRSHPSVPEIERPVVSSGSGFAKPDDLQLRAEAIKLTRSVMNATLHYRITLINRSIHAVPNVSLGADVVSAHGGVPVEEQIASTSLTLEKRHDFGRIAPGQTVRFDGQVTLPLSQARIIRQGPAALFVPLLRLRLDRTGQRPVVKTFVIGLGVPNGGRVMPFRIDEGPRSYEPIAARALD